MKFHIIGDNFHYLIISDYFFILLRKLTTIKISEITEISNIPNLGKLCWVGLKHMSK
jgi:hypothetical protein